jgi:hypothetical protein
VNGKPQNTIMVNGTMMMMMMMIIIIIIISRKCLNRIPGKHDDKRLQKTAILWEVAY